MNLEEFFDKMNDQMNYEFESAYVYKAMAAYTADEDYGGFTHFLNMQVNEEFTHAEKFKAFLQEIGRKVKWQAIPEPKSDYSSLLEVFETALNHEKEVTQRINELVDFAREVNDKRSEIFLHWFVTEQVEEEGNFNSLVLRLKRIANSQAGLYQLNGELYRRE